MQKLAFEIIHVNVLKWKTHFAQTNIRCNFLNDQLPFYWLFSDYLFLSFPLSSPSTAMSKQSLYENLLPNFVGSTLAVSDLSQSYEENLTFRNFAFVSFHPMIVHRINIHSVIQKSCHVKGKTCLVLNVLNWRFFSFSH